MEDDLESDDELDNEPGTGSLWIGVALLALVVALVAFFKSIGEVRYWWSGTETTGRVTGVTDDLQVGKRTGYIVWYEFGNQATGRKVSGTAGIDVADKARFARGSAVKIEYVGGQLFTSRLQGTGSLFWPILLVVSSLVMVGCIVPLLIRASRTYRDEEDPEEREL